tara:strand:- start:66 stop:404 length:339 start_codon:yes stop_codon:yes gene_type:complete
MPKLYGDIIKGKEFMSFEFTDKDFNKYFGKEDNFKSLIAKGLRPFDIDSDIKNNKSNENIVVVSNNDCICYSYNKANGPHPERYQSRDDYTDWIKSDVGLKNLNDVLKILGK